MPQLSVLCACLHQRSYLCASSLYPSKGKITKKLATCHRHVCHRQWQLFIDNTLTATMHWATGTDRVREWDEQKGGRSCVKSMQTLMNREMQTPEKGRGRTMMKRCTCFSLSLCVSLMPLLRTSEWLITSPTLQIHLAIGIALREREEEAEERGGRRERVRVRERRNEHRTECMRMYTSLHYGCWHKWSLNVWSVTGNEFSVDSDK